MNEVKGRSIHLGPQEKLSYHMSWYDIPLVKFQHGLKKLNFQGCTFYIYQDVMPVFEECVFDNCTFRGTGFPTMAFRKCSLENTPMPRNAIVAVECDIKKGDNPDKVTYLSESFSGACILHLGQKDDVSLKFYEDLFTAMPDTFVGYWKEQHNPKYDTHKVNYSMSAEIGDYFVENTLPILAKGREYTHEFETGGFMYSNEELGYSKIIVTYEEPK